MVVLSEASGSFSRCAMSTQLKTSGGPFADLWSFLWAFFSPIPWWLGSSDSRPLSSTSSTQESPSCSCWVSLSTHVVCVRCLLAIPVEVPCNAVWKRYLIIPRLLMFQMSQRLREVSYGMECCLPRDYLDTWESDIGNLTNWRL